MTRISRKHLESKVATINSLLGAPAESYTLRGDRYTANIGNYHIGANSPGDSYGTRYCLHKMVNDGGGVTVVYGTQVCGAQDFADVLSAMISGIQAMQEYIARERAAQTKAPIFGAQGSEAIFTVGGK